MAARRFDGSFGLFGLFFALLRVLPELSAIFRSPRWRRVLCHRGLLHNELQRGVDIDIATFFSSCPKQQQHWAGERLSLEGAIPEYRRVGCPISVSAVPFCPGTDIWRSCRLLASLMRSLCLLPGGWVGLFLAPLVLTIAV